MSSADWPRRPIRGALLAFAVAYAVMALVGILVGRDSSSTPSDGLTYGPPLALGVLLFGGVLGWFWAPFRRQSDPAQGPVTKKAASRRFRLAGQGRPETKRSGQARASAQDASAQNRDHHEQDN